MTQDEQRIEQQRARDAEKLRRVSSRTADPKEIVGNRVRRETHGDTKGLDGDRVKTMREMLSRPGVGEGAIRKRFGESALSSPELKQAKRQIAAARNRAARGDRAALTGQQSDRAQKARTAVTRARGQINGANRRQAAQKVQEKAQSKSAVQAM